MDGWMGRWTKTQGILRLRFWMLGPQLFLTGFSLQPSRFIVVCFVLGCSWVPRFHQSLAIDCFFFSSLEFEGCHL